MLRKVISAPANRWLKDNYGSWRGFVRTEWSHLHYLLGGYQAYRKVDWQLVERLVFVCKGNICRSAYAEALAKSLGVNAVSCGLYTKNGLPADDCAIQAAILRGIDLSKHRTTRIEALDLKKNDLFVAMEPWQAVRLDWEYGKEYGCTLLGLWGQPVNPHIQDPFGMSGTYFDYCFNYIDNSFHEILKKISQPDRS
jgi:low molecular weight protein-tyrosine phosphatase